MNRQTPKLRIFVGVLDLAFGLIGLTVVMIIDFKVAKIESLMVYWQLWFVKREFTKL